MRTSTVTLSLMVIPAIVGAASQTIVETDFGQAAVPVADVSESGEKRITGFLPEGWREDSGWNHRIRLSYTRQVEHGRRFLRVYKTDGGQGQLAFHMGEIPQETYYRLTFSARSAARSNLIVGIRLVGPPYEFLWSVRPPLRPRWQDFVYEFRLKASPNRVGLWLTLEEDGSYDLSRVKLVAFSREDVIASLKAQYPQEAPGNLVRVSQFLLGLPSGWALGRDCSDGDEVRIRTDRQRAGPSGAPSLWIESQGSWVLYTAPVFIPRSFEPHTASLYARGSGRLRLTAFGEGGEHSQEYALQPSQWQRVTITFTPVLKGMMHQLRLEGEGSVWLDAFQVERGSQATDYAPARPCQVALALPESDASVARIQFADEPPAILYAVRGAPSGSVLRLTQYDLYGAKTRLEVRNPRPEGRLLLKLPAAHPLGTFRVEAYVEDGRGRIISPVDEVVFHRVRRPRYWNKPAPRSPFGVHTVSTTRHIVMAKAIGVNWTRLHDAGREYTSWAFLEPTPGNWKFRDEELRRYEKYGLKILGLLSTSPLWANYQEKSRHWYWDYYVQPKDLRQFAHYVRTVVERYKDLIDSYDVWNEPWGISFWSLGWDFEKGGFKEDPNAEENFARLQAAAYEAAKAVDPRITILGFNTEGTPNGTLWTKGLLPFGALQNCDAIGYHHYSFRYNGYPGDDVHQAWEYAIGPIIQQDGQLSKPVWMTEGNPICHLLNNGFYHYTMCGEPIDDSWAIGNRLCRYMVSLLAQGVQKVFLYSMHIHSGAAVPSAASWRVFTEDDGYLHPSGVAYANLAWLIEDTEFVERRNLAPGVFAYIFASPERAVAVLSTHPEHEKFVVPSAPGIETIDLFGNPVPPNTRLENDLVYLTAPSLRRLESVLRSRTRAR